MCTCLSSDSEKNESQTLSYMTFRHAKQKKNPALDGIKLFTGIEAAYPQTAVSLSTSIPGHRSEADKRGFNFYRGGI